tara:strand:- start:1404 stop:1688 length:285 start_codon:yes stop_codon:yes gene_type:complete
MSINIGKEWRWMDSLKKEKKMEKVKIGAREYTPLDSVGCYLDSVNGIVYPQLIEGEISLDFEVSLFNEELSADWYEGLSTEDLKIVNDCLNNKL